MPDIFQPNLAATQGGENFVRQAVGDNSAAKALQSFGKMGTEVFKGSVIADLEGTEDNKDFVDPSDPNLAGMTAEDITRDLNLTNIAAARKQGNLTGAAAAALVSSKAKALITAHPYFSQEIKSATSAFFSGTLGGKKGGTGSGGFFTDPAPEKSLLDKALETGAKAGRIDPTVSRGQQIHQLKGHTERTIAKSKLSLSKLGTDILEQRKNINERQGSQDYFAGDGIIVEKEISDIMTQLKDSPTADLIVRLNQLRIDKDAEARQSIDVSRIGEGSYQAQYKAVVGAKIDLALAQAGGEITQTVAENQLKNLKTMGELRVYQVPGMAEMAATMAIVKNVPVGLIAPEVGVQASALLSKMISLVPAAQARTAGGNSEQTGRGNPTLAVLASDEADLLYRTLKDSTAQVQGGQKFNREQMNSEIGLMLEADADGVSRHADMFDQKRWDSLMTFYSSPDMLKYMKENSSQLSDKAIGGLKNAIDFEYSGSLMRAARKQMEGSINSQLDTGSAADFFSGRDEDIGSRPMKDFVSIEVTDGQIRFVVNPTANRLALGDFGNKALMRRLEKLNSNYGSRINQFVRTSAHLSGSNNYDAILQRVLEDHQLISKGTGSDS